MTMTKKDFIGISAGIASSKGVACTRCRAIMACMIAGYLQSDNPRFNQDKFYDACLLDKDIIDEVLGRNIKVINKI